MLLLLSLLCPSQAGRVVVDPAGGGDFTDLQVAADSVVPGDYLVLMPGTYGSVSFSSWAGPVIGVQGPESTWVMASGSAGMNLSTPGRYLISSVSVQGGSYGINASGYGANTHLQAVSVYDATTAGVYLNAGAQSAHSLQALQVSNSSVGVNMTAGQLALDQASLAGNNTHLYLNSGSATLARLVTDSGTPLGCSSSALATVQYALVNGYSSNPWGSCSSQTAVFQGFDVGFVQWTHDGDSSNDDLRLLASSPGVDAGGSGCLDADGSPCDLGAFGGPIGSDVDTDGDGMHAAWELLWGLDPAVDDGWQDIDGDGLDNLGELLFGTSPLHSDTDADGVPDLAELQALADPNDAADQAPVASLQPLSTGFLGESISVDGSASTDPGGDALTYAWRFTQQPQGSALNDAALGGTAQVAFTPDLAGVWGLELTVSDGHQSAAATAQVTVLASRVLRIPQDIGTWAEALPDLQPGMEVVFDEGQFDLGGALPADLTLRGAGRDLTTLELGGNLLSVNQVGLRLRDLQLNSQAYTALTTSGSVHVDLRRVRVDCASGYALYINPDALITAWDLEVLGDIAMYAQNANLQLANTRLMGGRYGLYQDRGRIDLNGVLLYGSSIGAQLQNVAGTLEHLTASSPQTSLYLLGDALTHLRNSYVHSTLQGLVCSEANDLLIDHLAVSGVEQVNYACPEPMRVVEDLRAPESNGELSFDSSAIDRGDWRERDADGSLPDLGATGGLRGLDQTPPVADPLADDDDDGLDALLEWMLGTSDDLTDSDGDGVADLDELLGRQSPTDPLDNLPEVTAPAVLRGLEGQALRAEVSWDDDPQGDACDFSWDDGQAQAAREFELGAPGAQAASWTLSCGDGARRGQVLLISEQAVRIPEDVPTLALALAQAQPHHRLMLAEQRFEGPLTLGELPLAVEGAGRGTRVAGGVTGAHPGQELSRLGVEGDVQLNGGALRGVEVWGELRAAQASLSATLVVDGALQLYDGQDVINVTVQGDVQGNADSLSCSANTGALSVGPTATHQHHTLTGPGHFILDQVEPDQAILEPWPGSLLWDSCSIYGPDPDGSPRDIGHSGGPDALAVDVDVDGMNDRWEGLHAVDQPGADPDGDTLHNLAEFRLGTDPNLRDTDGDRVPDNEDSAPRDPANEGLVARIAADELHPRVNQRVGLSAANSSDPAHTALSFAWTLSAPAGSAAALTTEGHLASFVPDIDGLYEVALTVTAADGAVAQTSRGLYTLRDRRVPLGGSVQAAIDAALPGERILLEEGEYTGGIVVDKDLVIAHAEGAMEGTLDGGDAFAVVQVTGGAQLRLENLSVRPSEGQVGVYVEDSLLELRQGRIIGGGYALYGVNAELQLLSSAVLDSQALIALSPGVATVRNSALGWLSEDGWPAFSGQQMHVFIEASILDVSRSPSPGLVSCGLECDVSLQSSLLSRDLSPNEPWVTRQGVLVGDPRYLLSPYDADSPRRSDMRLSPSSPAHDAGPSDLPDVDGSLNDLGTFGGPWGDWPDVDNDRDGYSNDEGDCDDGDPQIWPDPWTGACPAVQGCAGCAAGGPAPVGALPWAAALLGLLMRRRRAAGDGPRPRR